jgi:hypothetical protein
VLEGLENDARQAKKGLWADPQPRGHRGRGSGDAGAGRSALQSGAGPRRGAGIDTWRINPTDRSSQF